MVNDVGSGTTTAGGTDCRCTVGLGGHDADQRFDRAVVELCQGPIDRVQLRPGRLVTHLIQRGIPALGVDQSEIRCARPGSGALVLLRDLFERCRAPGRWETVLLADGNVGLGGDPQVLSRAAESISATGRCVVEFEAAVAGCARAGSAGILDNIGPWFRWASVGIDYAASLAEVGLAVIGILPDRRPGCGYLAPELTTPD